MPITVELFEYNELSEDAKKEAVKNYRKFLIDNDMENESDENIIYFLTDPDEVDKIYFGKYGESTGDLVIRVS